VLLSEAPRALLLRSLALTASTRAQNKALNAALAQSAAEREALAKQNADLQRRVAALEEAAAAKQ
jgi:cell division protein FtsB